jgi:outer membrane protein TolC
MLELQKTNARTSLTNARIARNRAAKELATYLGMDRATDIELIIPSVIGSMHIDATEAIALARENNPTYLAKRQTTAEARREAERAKVEKNFSVSLDASVGLNQVADNFSEAYRNLLSQDKATITLSIPLKDWGKRKNAYLAARSTVDVAERAEQESARDIELEVALTVADFNERQSIVETSRQALTIAEDTYAQTLQRFIRAQANAYDLSLAQSHWQTARQNQIASLQNYWLSYFHLRRLTLYDYQRNKSITYSNKK